MSGRCNAGLRSPFALSLVVIARDEADRIGACLDSVPEADEKLVLDCGSRDRTPQVARAHGARVLRTDWPGFAAQRNRGLALARGRWVLFLDADERLSPGAMEALRAGRVRHPDAAGFSFPICTHWGGQAIRHGWWYPDRKVRAVRRGRGRWHGDLHERLAVDGPVVALRGDVLHFPYRTVWDHLSRIDRYSRMHAELVARDGPRPRAWDPLLRPALHFVNGFLLKHGYRDGRAGLAIAALGAAHVALKWSRARRLRARADR